MRSFLHRCAVPAALLLIGVACLAPPAYAGNLTNGLFDVVTGPLELPKQILIGTLTGPPIIGTLTGVVAGAFSAVGTTLRGAAELASGTLGLGSALAPLAPYVLPFIL